MLEGNGIAVAREFQSDLITEAPIKRHFERAEQRLANCVRGAEAECGFNAHLGVRIEAEWNGQFHQALGA